MAESKIMILRCCFNLQISIRYENASPAPKIPTNKKLFSTNVFMVYEKKGKTSKPEKKNKFFIAEKIEQLPCTSFEIKRLLSNKTILRRTTKIIMAKQGNAFFTAINFSSLFFRKLNIEITIFYTNILTRQLIFDHFSCQ